jgi:flagellar assembly protein FliH
MLSKLLKNSDAHATPVPWRMSQAPAGKLTLKNTGPAAEQPESPVEILQLRARIAELSAAADQQVRQAHEAGVRAGEAAAGKRLEGEVHTVVEKLAAAVAEVAGVRAATIHRAETDTVKLAIEIARRVLHRELTVDPSALEALIKAALEKLQSQEVYRVRVHPDQEKVVRRCLEQMGRSDAVTVIGDPVQPKGGAIFEISRGTLDASVDTQLSEIERGLTDQMESRA